MSEIGKLKERGSVLICIVSPTRVILVRDKTFAVPRWKLPGGSVETSDRDVIDAAIREANEETGIVLSRNQVRLHMTQRRVNGEYYPHFAVAHVSESFLQTRAKTGRENGHALEVAAFERLTALKTTPLLEKHHQFVQIGLATRM